MKRTIGELRAYLLSLADDVDFRWNGERGLIIPFTQQKYILCWTSDDPGTEFHDVDALLQAPYLEGHSISDVCDQLEFLR